MPVIASAIINQGGKILLSRHYMDITRIRVEGLLSAFPKLLVSSSSGDNHRQYTFIDSGSVRYVYQPVEDLYLVLITTKGSNIVEDLATLRLLARILSEFVPSIDEALIQDKCFEILFAFDEAITGGLRENVSLDQVVALLEMHSHEEELAKEAEKKQLEMAKKESRRRAQEISKQKREQGGGSYGGIGSGGGDHGGGDMDSSSGSGGAGHHRGSSDVVEQFAAPSHSAGPKLGSGGMKFGKAKKAEQSKAVRVMQEAGGGEALAPSGLNQATAASGAEGQGATSAVNQQGIHIKIEENVSATLNRDGGLSSLDIRGDLFIHVSDPAVAQCKILLGRYNEEFTFKTHPNVNKNLFQSERVLTIKDGKPYPTQQTLGIVRWRMQTPGKTVKAPISVNCWPGSSNITIEYELEDPNVQLHNVAILVPLGGAACNVDEISSGEWNVENGGIVWRIPLVDAKSNSGTMDVALDREVDQESFFPTQIAFACPTSLAGVVVHGVTSSETGIEVPYSSECLVQTDQYVVS